MYSIFNSVLHVCIFNKTLFFQVLETCVKNCGHRFHVHVCTQDFVEGVLVRAILPKNNPPMVLQDRVLSLIQVSTQRRIVFDLDYAWIMGI